MVLPKAEALRTWTSVFSFKEEGYQMLVELIKKDREKVSPK